MNKKTAKIKLNDIKDSDGWMELCHKLSLSEEKIRQYFEYGEYANLELEVDKNLNIVGGKILKHD